jgi:uncharacterized membrane protein
VERPADRNKVKNPGSTWKQELGNISSSTCRVGGFLCSLLLVCVAGTALAAEPFEIICDGQATDISADGSVVVGTDSETGETWRWTSQTGRVLLGSVGGSARKGIDRGSPDISHDSRLVSATATSAESDTESLARWSEEGGWDFPTRLPEEPEAERQKRMSLAWGLSGDGSTLVGQVRYSDDSTRAAAWKSGHPLVVLEGPEVNSRANHCNSDGSVIVGWSEHQDTGIWQPTAWIEGQPVILSRTKAFCQATAVNGAGQIIVGQSYDESRDQRIAALWLNSDFGWVSEQLGSLPGTMGGYGQAMALDLTDDAHTIVGFNEFDPNRSTGFIWTLDDGMADAASYLASRDIDLPEGFRITSVTAITPDGDFMTGHGEDMTFWPHQVRSFVIRTGDLPRRESAKDTAPAGMGMTNPFKTRRLR